MTSKSFKSLVVAGFSLLMIFFSNILMAQSGPEKKEEKKLDPAKIIMEHVSDGHEFHFATVGGHHVYSFTGYSIFPFKRMVGVYVFGL